MDAANAYAGALKNQGLASGLGNIGADNIGDISGNTQGSGSFSEVLKAALSDTGNSVNVSTNTGIAALNGKADLVDVVTSVQNAEMVLETVVAVRDKVIAAYQDIIKMPI
ncbi:MAG: flagellar hook-basal body complex protein FliE [Alphaproteobacteria bacterium]|nr:flagellar hook-basal body complex protein FliE [Alphaproteobacteria bacterium]